MQYIKIALEYSKSAKIFKINRIIIPYSIYNNNNNNNNNDNNNNNNKNLYFAFYNAAIYIKVIT